MEELKKLYYDPLRGFIGPNKLYEKAKEENINVSKKQVRSFVSNQETAQINKARKRKRKEKYNSIIAFSPGDCGQMDLMIYDRYAFNNYRYILCYVDVYSRYAQAKALTNKRMETLISASKAIFQKMGYPNNLNADQEFNKAEFNKLMKEHKVRTWYSDPEQSNKNAIVERFNRTLADLLQKHRTAYKKYDWNKYLPDIISNYNNTKHTTTGHKPSEIFENKESNEQEIKHVKNPFKQGDNVRVFNKVKIFDKNDKPKLSAKVYQVATVEGQKMKLINPETNNLLKETYRPAQLYKITKVERLQTEPSEQKRHVKEKKERKVNKQLKQVGVEPRNLRPGKRALKPSARLRDPNMVLDDEL
jgi:hypothetical protein